LQDRVDSEARSQASSQANIVAATSPGLTSGQQLALVRQAANSSRGRVVIVDARGVAVADSEGPAGVSFANRPEFRAALAGKTFQERRHSETLNEEILATAVPIVDGPRVTGAVRVTQSVEAVNASVRRAWLGLALIALIVLMIGLAAGIVIARFLTEPVSGLQAAAGAIAAGDLEKRADIAGTTEQRSLARSFNEMTDRLADALSSQREFVANASHQLRTPLAGLRLRIEEAQAAGVSRDAEHELRAALREVDRLSGTVDELLLLSRMGDRDAPAESVDLAASARAAAARFAAAAAERGMTVEVEADGAAHVLCAPADLERALDAVVENAIAYGRDGGAVTLAAGPGRVAVLDRGPGFAAGEEEQVFERFQRGSAGRGAARGSGLGLPIARALVERWGGTAYARNRPDGGAEVVLELPRG
jgi:signal transduction histidine kinase